MGDYLPGWSRFTSSFTEPVGKAKAAGVVAKAGEAGAEAGEGAAKAAGTLASKAAQAGAVVGENAGKAGAAVATGARVVVGAPVVGGQIVGKASSGFLGGLFKGLGGGANGSGLVKFLLKPLDVTLHGAGMVVRGARANPWVAGGTALVVGGVWATHAVRKGAENRTKKQLLEQAAAVQQQQGNPYQVSPADAAALDAKMKQGGNASGFAQAELASRGDQAALASRQ